jgi:uncharacterized protein (DUF433 family)
MDFRKIITKMHELDPTTPGQDLQHFTQLAESTGIALGAKEVVTEAAKPDYIDIDGDGDKKEPMKKAVKDKKDKKEKVKEAAEGKMPSKKEVMKCCKDGMSVAEICKKYPDCDQKKLKEMCKDCKEEMKESVNEAEQIIKAEKKAKLPSKKSILMMCSKGMSVKEMCEAHPDCDQDKLKEMCEACMEEYKKKKDESVSFVDMDGEIVEAKSAAQKKAQEKFKNMVKGKKSDDKEMDEGAYGKKKKKPVKESVETKMSFVDMYKMVKESGGQQAIDPMDDVLWTWANRVAVSKVEETNKQEIFAAMLYERNGGRFEMYDVVEKGLTEGKDCNCGPECACKGNCEPNCNCGPEC